MTFIEAVSYPGDVQRVLTLYSNPLCESDGTETMGSFESMLYTDSNDFVEDNGFGARAPMPDSDYCSRSSDAPQSDFVLTTRGSVEEHNVQAVMYCNSQ